jgi:hypothetical protein
MIDAKYLRVMPLQLGAQFREELPKMLTKLAFCPSLSPLVDIVLSNNARKSRRLETHGVRGPKV